MSKKLLRVKVRSVVKPQHLKYRPLPKLWPDSTIVCIGSGPSLTQADCDYVRGKARVIVINTSIVRAPWADVLYACDARWWKWPVQDPKKYPGVAEFRGLTVALTRDSAHWRKGVHILQNTGADGLDLRPHAIRTGQNSGHQAVNVAVHLGAKRILLLGYDMQRSNGKEHWHADHPMPKHNPYSTWRRLMQTTVAPLQTLGIEVINCSRETALECFPRMTIEEALESVRPEHLLAVTRDATPPQVLATQQPDAMSMA